MPESRPPRAVVFDFDGVILESVDVKTRAFEALFSSESPEAVSRIIAHHLRNGGISRFEKFRYAYREVLKRPLGKAEEEALGQRFNALVEDAVAVADWVPGAREFIESRHASLPLFVASGAPETELRRIVERRELARYFRGIYGTPPTKDAILKRVGRELGCAAADILLVGDAINDYEGSSKAGARFLGRVRPGLDNPFPAGVRVVADLTALSEEMLRA